MTSTTVNSPTTAKTLVYRIVLVSLMKLILAPNMIIGSLINANYPDFSSHSHQLKDKARAKRPDWVKKISGRYAKGVSCWHNVTYHQFLFRHRLGNKAGTKFLGFIHD